MNPVIKRYLDNMGTESNKLKLLYIEWEDASATASWKTMSEALKFVEDGFIVRQVGWKLKEDKTCIVLAGSINPQKSEDNTLYSELIRIPKTWIRKRIDLTPHING